jgi:hypothetical protein
MKLVMNVRRREGDKAANDIATQWRRDVAGRRTGAKLAPPDARRASRGDTDDEQQGRDHSLHRDHSGDEWVGREKGREGEQGKGRVLSFDERDFGSSLASRQRAGSFEVTGPLKSRVLRSDCVFNIRPSTSAAFAMIPGDDRDRDLLGASAIDTLSSKPT